MKMKEYIRAEVQTRQGEPKLKILAKILFVPRFNAVYLIRKALLSRSAFFKSYYRRKLALRYGIYLGNNTKIGKGLVVGHPTSIVIGDGVVIGENCILYQQTTIGLKEAGSDSYPVIGDNVVIYAGAKVIGAVEIGDNSAIGANAVVTKSCPADVIMKGVPAKCTNKKRCF